MVSEHGEGALRTRQRLLEVAAGLLAAAPAGEISTRAVCEAAGVTSPTLYHHFGDKHGLIEAVLADAYERYLMHKHTLEPTGDLVADFRRGWDLHVEFGVDNPGLYALMYGRPLVGPVPAAAATARAELLGVMRSLEQAGRLRLPVELATDIVESAATGLTLHLIRHRRPVTDPAVALARDAVTDTVIGPLPRYGRPSVSTEVLTAAAQLRAVLPNGAIGSFSTAEIALLHEWLRRLGDSDDH